MSTAVLIAPSGFKGSLDAVDTAAAMAAGVRRAWPDARITTAPVPDGGEGFTRVLVQACGGALHTVTVTGPLGERVEAAVGMLDGRSTPTAVIEISAACGLSLIPGPRRNPELTTSYGVGELILAALDLDAKRILVGCGDSGVNDGGAGLIQALGGRLLDRHGRQIGRGGGRLCRLETIDLAALDARLRAVEIDVTVNWHNSLLGDGGVTRVYGRQKGASADQIVRLEAGLEHFARLIHATTGIDVASQPGAGASGGIGTAFAGLLGAHLRPRYDTAMECLRMDELLARADIVFTAEGSLDGQTPHGKVPSEIGRRAAALGVPVVALAGCIADGARAALASGISAYASVLAQPCTLSEAMAQAAELIEDAAEQTARMIGAGQRIRERQIRQRGKARHAARRHTPCPCVLDMPA